MRKLRLKRNTVRLLASPELSLAAGGVVVGSLVSCLGGCNTLMICIDTNAATNCNCGPGTFQCPSVSCPPVPL